MFIHLDMLDAAIEWLINSAAMLYVCSREPANYADIDDCKLAEISISHTDFIGPLDSSEDNVQGRMVLVTTVNGTGLKDGQASNVVLASSSDLLCVVPCTAVEVAEGVPLVVEDWCITIDYNEDPCVIPEGYI